MATRDPEVEAILTRSRELTSEVFRLSRELNYVADDLTSFAGKFDRRRSDAPSYEGEDRRGR